MVEAPTSPAHEPKPSALSPRVTSVSTLLYPPVERRPRNWNRNVAGKPSNPPAHELVEQPATHRRGFAGHPGYLPQAGGRG